MKFLPLFPLTSIDSLPYLISFNLMMAAYLSKKTMAPIIGGRSPLHVIFGRLTLFHRLFKPQSIRMHVLCSHSIPCTRQTEPYISPCVFS